MTKRHPARPGVARPQAPGDQPFGTQWGWDREFRGLLATSTCRPTSGRRRSRICPGSPIPPSSPRAASTSRSSGRRSTTWSRTGPARGSGRARSARRSTPRARFNSLQLGRPPVRRADVVDAGDANVVPAHFERGHAMIYRKVREVAATGAIPIVLGGDHSITWPSASAIAEVRRPGQHRDRPLRRPRRHGARFVGPAGRPRLADAPAHRVRRGPRPQLRPGRAARLLAAGRRSSSGCASRACAGTS